MTDYEIHGVSYSGTTTAEWSAPRESDFETDDLSAIDDHFLLSESGFPPEEYGDLNVPVVDADDELNLNGLRTAYAGAHSVEAVDDLDLKKEGQVKGVIQQLAENEFDEHIE